MFLKNSFLYASPEILNVILRFFVGLFSAKILGPENLGISAAIGFIFAYSVLLQFGSTDGMHLRVYDLYKRGTKYQTLKRYYVNTSFTFINLILSFVFIILLFYLSIFKDSSYVIWVGIIVNILISYFYQYSLYLQLIARYDYDFKTIYKIQVIDYLFKSALTVGFVYYFELLGLFIGLFLGNLFTVIISTKYIKYQFKWFFNKKLFKRMIVLGFPILLIGAVLTVFQTIDRWFILSYFNTKSLGYFTIIFTFSSMLLVVPIKILSVVIQYFREFHAKSKDNCIIYLGMIELMFIFTVLNGVLVLLTQEFIFYLFKYYLYKYQLSYEIVKPMLSSTYFMGLFHIISSYFVIINKKIYTIMSMIAGLLISIIFNIIAVKFFGTLGSIAYATLGSSIVMVLMMFFFFYNKEYPSIVIFIKLNVLLVSFIVMGVLLNTHSFDTEIIENFYISLKTIVCILVIAGVTFMYYKNNRNVNLRKILGKS